MTDSAEPSPRCEGQVWLAAHGSFNPVHRHHVEMMVAARRVLEAAGYEVVGGVLAPAHRSHLLSKGVAAVADRHRLEALRLACAAAEGPAGWLRDEPRGFDYGSCHRMMAQLLQPEFEERFPGSVGFEVKGADVVNKYKSYHWDVEYPCVIVGRDGDTAELEAGLQANGVEKVLGTRLFVIRDELPGCMSSTRLREALETGNSELTCTLCGKDVAEYLLRNASDLYVESADEISNRGRAPWLRHRAELGPSDAFVVAVVGPSGAGKTTLCQGLGARLGARVVSQEAHPSYEKAWLELSGCWKQSWEEPAVTDWEGLVRDVAGAEGLVLVEGHNVLHDERLRQRADAVLRLEVSEADALARRGMYPPEWTLETYFSEVLWPAHLQHRAQVDSWERLQEVSQATLDSSSLEIPALLEKACTVVEGWLEAWKAAAPSSKKARAEESCA